MHNTTPHVVMPLFAGFVLSGSALELESCSADFESELHRSQRTLSYANRLPLDPPLFIASADFGVGRAQSPFFFATDYRILSHTSVIEALTLRSVLDRSFDHPSFGPFLHLQIAAFSR
jgi:hypothetical protein